MRSFGELQAYPLRSGLTVSASSRGTGIKMLNMGELFRYQRIPSVAMARVEVEPGDQARTLLQRGDLMFARRSLTWEGAGKCSIVLDVNEPTTWESSIIRARLNRQVALPEYYFYYFQSPQGRRQIEGIIEQVAAAGIRLSELRELRVPVPKMHTQAAFAAVLGALDDKIAANEQTCRLLAALSLAVFRRATEDGAVATVGKIVQMVSRGIAPKYVESDGIVVLNQKCVRGQIVSLAPARLTAPNSRLQDKLLQHNDVLVNSTGQGTLGRVARWLHNIEATVDSHISIVRFEPSLIDPVCAGYALQQLEGEIEGLAEGSTGQTELRRDLLAGLSVAVPRPDAQTELGGKLSSLDNLAMQLRVESQRLAAARDELLPLLMSGRIRVRDAEKVAEEVT